MQAKSFDWNGQKFLVLGLFWVFSAGYWVLGGRLHRFKVTGPKWKEPGRIITWSGSIISAIPWETPCRCAAV